MVCNTIFGNIDFIGNRKYFTDMMRSILIVVIGIFSIQGVLISQTNPRTGQYEHRHNSTVVSPDYALPGLQRNRLIAQLTEGEDVFRTVQQSIVKGDFDELTRHFGKHIYLNMRSIESGYYSANHAQFVVQNFFNVHKPISFSFTTYGESGGAPYATGRGSINVKGNREYIQVYVSLVKQRDRWVIAQFNVY